MLFCFGAVVLDLASPMRWDADVSSPGGTHVHRPRARSRDRQAPDRHFDHRPHLRRPLRPGLVRSLFLLVPQARAGVLMKVELYEKIWMYLAVVLLTAFAGTVLFAAYAGGLHPPSNVETIDPKTVHDDPRFALPGVTTNTDGSVEVAVVAQMWAFNPG